MYGKESKKQLIVNADDFGWDSAINSGIINAFEKGIVTNASLMTCGSAFDEAVGLAKKYKDLGIGIHLSINEERPVSHRDKIVSLLNDDGDCFLNLPVFLRRFLSGKIVLGHIYLEFESQIERFIKSGLKPTHIDSHKHIHLIPGIFGISLELAKRFGIFRIRSPRVNFSCFLRSGRRYLRAIEILGLSTLANIQLQKLKRNVMKTADYCYGLVESGCLNKEQLIAILKNLPIGTSELVCHPGFSTEDLLKGHRWNYNWQVELMALTNRDMQTLVDSLDIKLISYNEI